MLNVYPDMFWTASGDHFPFRAAENEAQELSRSPLLFQV